jgi:protein tyrosine/serine phosphatase
MGLRRLSRLGVKTVLNLRLDKEHSQDEERVVEAMGMRYIHLPMHRLEAVTDQQVAQALSVLNDQNAWPIYVHCEGGRDRTGVVVACYRISHDNWSNQKALAEARQCGIRRRENYILSFRSSTESRSRKH